MITFGLPDLQNKFLQMKTISFLAVIIFLPVISFASTFYWVGGTGKWSAYSTHWATSSGGSTFQTQVPSSLDDVIFDANSFSSVGDTLKVDQTIAFCKNMDWQSVTNNPTFACTSLSSKIKIFGSFTLSQYMNIQFNGIISFEAMTVGNTIKSNNNSLACNLEFNGFNGDWTLQDSLTISQSLTINYGILKTNNNNVQCNHFYANNNTPGGLLMGTSVFTCTQYWTIYNTTFSLDADSSYIKITGGGIQTNGPTSRFKYNIIEFLGNNAPMLDGGYNNIKKLILHGGGEIHFNYSFLDSLFCSGNQLRITNGSHRTINFIQAVSGFQHSPDKADSINTITVTGNSSLMNNGGMNYFNVYGNAFFNGDLSISNNPSDNVYSTFKKCTIMGNGNITGHTNYFDTLKLNIGYTYTFGANSSQTITKWFDCFGNPGFPIQLVSDNFGQQATLNIQQNYFCSDYLYMRDMNGTGSSSLYVGANSNNVYDNSGWLFSACNTGVHKISNLTFDIYPNPTIGKITIHSSENISEIGVTNALGEKVYQSTNSITQQPTIDLSSEPNGIYFLQLKTERGIASKKLIINK